MWELVKAHEEDPVQVVMWEIEYPRVSGVPKRYWVHLPTEEEAKAHADIHGGKVITKRVTTAYNTVHEYKEK